MAKHTITGFITFTPPHYKGDKTIGFSTYKPSAEYSPETVVIGEHSFEVEVPDKFDPRPQMVERLEEQKRLLRAETTRKVKEIDDRIQNLLAIEHNPS